MKISSTPGPEYRVLPESARTSLLNIATPEDRRWLLLTSTGATLLLIAVGLLFGAGLYDDGYIFLRYAENIAAGLGPVFNTGERVEGFSSPLWTLLLGMLALTPVNLEFAATLLGIVTGMGLFAALGLNLLAYRPDMKWEWTALVAGQAFFPAVVFYCFSGLDQILFAMLIGFILWSSSRDLESTRVSWLTASLLALAFASRNEGALLAIWVSVVFTNRSMHKRRGWLRNVVFPLACSAAAMASLVSARFLYFGTVFPNTYYAKISPGISNRLVNGIAYLFDSLLVLFPLLSLIAILAVVAWRKGVFPWTRALLPTGWILVWIAFVVYAGGDHFPMHRLLLPALPALVILVGCFAASLRDGMPPSSRVALRAALVGCLILGSTISYLDQGHRARREHRLAAEWAKYGRWIHDNTPADTLVATTVVGAIGYFGKRPMVDLLGLVNAKVAREGEFYSGAAHGHARYHTSYVLERRPDLIVYYTRSDTRRPDKMFLPKEKIRKRFSYALFDIANHPETPELYQQILVPTEDGTLIEFLKKRSFPLDALYLPAPELPSSGS
jgi:arabinofuranosyltransferase